MAYGSSGAKSYSTKHNAGGQNGVVTRRPMGRRPGKMKPTPGMPEGVEASDVSQTGPQAAGNKGTDKYLAAGRRKRSRMVARPRKGTESARSELGRSPRTLKVRTHTVTDDPLTFSPNDTGYHPKQPRRR